MKKIQFNEQKFEKAIDLFKKYSNEPRFEEDIKERAKRKGVFKELISAPLDELKFSSIIKNLWSAQIWRNQDYLIKTIVSKNGLEKLNKEFSLLISKKNTPGERYERFLNNIKGMGPSMVTEIICHIDPQNAGIWNDKARKALGWLETKGIPYETYKINNKEYNVINEFFKSIADYFREMKYKDVDLLFVDYFLWEVATKLAKEEVIKSVDLKKSGSRHDELRDKVAQIGAWLGFETETEKAVSVGARVDVVWRARIANLGTVLYIFEVQDRGSIDGLILNLERAQNQNPAVQKLIVISDITQIERIKKEIGTLSENFRKAMSFWEAADVDITHQSLEQVTDSITKLRLMEE